MATMRIYDAAGHTKEFFYLTGPPIVDESPSKLTSQAEITSGRHQGKTVTTEMRGAFDLGSGEGSVTEMSQSVGGRLHFKVEMDRPTDMFGGFDSTLAEPLKVIGNRFDNLLEGERADDRLSGGGGEDRLTGLRGADRLEGGSGADRFIVNEARDSTPARRDVVVDFGRGNDRIDLRRIDADEGARGNQAFDLIGRAAFSGEAGELRFLRKGGDTFVYADTDGDGRAELAIKLEGRHVLDEGDFLL